MKTIYPIIIFPYSNPNKEHLKKLFGEIDSRMESENNIGDSKGKYKYAPPIIIINHHTLARVRNIVDKNLSDFDFLVSKEYIPKEYAEENVLPVWSVDTCQMWLYGFGEALKRCKNNAQDDFNNIEDVFWLIPGDFYYDDSPKDFFDNLFKIPKKVAGDKADIVLGEIRVPTASSIQSTTPPKPNSKQLIDTYGTYGLLYNWFADEAITINNCTLKPRTEFFAINYKYLNYVIHKRWFAYEQTIIILLRGLLENIKVGGNIHIDKQDLGVIEDDDISRVDLPSAMQQVERTERVLKTFWQETNATKKDWTEKYQQLDVRSEKIRATALIVLENALN